MLTAHELKWLAESVDPAAHPSSAAQADIAVESLQTSGVTVDRPAGQTTEEAQIFSTQPPRELVDVALDPRAAVRPDETTIAQADAETGNNQTENKFEASRVVTPNVLVLGKSADSDLIRFIGLDDQKLSAALADPMGVMEQEWFPFGFHTLEEEPANNDDAEYRQDLDEAYRKHRDGEIDDEELHDEIERVRDELEERKWNWWTTGANFDYITYGQVGDIDNYQDNFWLPPQVRHSFFFCRPTACARRL